jgi:beta-lactamase regulating signal transducer with metallopeptidase domain
MTPMFFVSSAARACVVLLVGLVAVTALPRASAATRRAVLVLTLASSLVVPILAALVPSWRIEAPPALGIFGHESALERRGLAGPAESLAPPSAARAFGAATSTVRANVPSLPLVAGSLWIVGVVLLLARAWRSSRRAQALVLRSTGVSGTAWDKVIACAVREAGAVAAVRLCDAVESPAVTGLLAPTVLLPPSAEGWSEERKRVVLVHELAHVRQGDGPAQLLADAACAWSWFNPLVWSVARRLRIERELAADNAVLLAGVRPSFYAEELLTQAGGAVRGALAMAERSSLGNRVVAILAAGRSRGGLATREKVLLTGASLVIAVAAACMVPTARAEAAVPNGALDPKMQAAAEAELTSLLSVAASESATVIILDPATGEVLANAGRRGGRPFDVARRQADATGRRIVALVGVETLRETASSGAPLGEPSGPEVAAPAFARLVSRLR